MRGYHLYSSIWEASVGEQLPCEWEHGNDTDLLAVSSYNRAVDQAHRYFLVLVRVLHVVGSCH